jgi:hypothetical protein
MSKKISSSNSGLSFQSLSLYCFDASYYFLKEILNPGKTLADWRVSPDHGDPVERVSAADVFLSNNISVPFAVHQGVDSLAFHLPVGQ